MPTQTQHWKAREADARAAARRWADVAAEHEREAAGKPWHPSRMRAMDARNREDTCNAIAAQAAEAVSICEAA